MEEKTPPYNFDLLTFTFITMTHFSKIRLRSGIFTFLTLVTFTYDPTFELVQDVTVLNHMHMQNFRSRGSACRER